jgi:Tfp pilus assembly protein FimT
MRRPDRRPPPARPGATLVELVLATVVLALLAAAGDVALRRLADAAAVRAATSEVAGAFIFARDRAAAEARPTAVQLDARSAAVTIVVAGDTIRHTPLAAGVRLAATRDSAAFAATGLGLGAANLSVVLARGAAAETVVVSRLGRVRW